MEVVDLTGNAANHGTDLYIYNEGDNRIGVSSDFVPIRPEYIGGWAQAGAYEGDSNLSTIELTFPDGHYGGNNSFMTLYRVVD